MGGGNPVKKLVSEVKRVVKDPVRTIAAVSTIGGVGIGASEMERAATGGVVTEALTGGAVTSKQTEALLEAQKTADRETASAVADAKAIADKAERDRNLRRKQQSKGRSSLLWAGTGELGVERKTTLG